MKNPIALLCACSFLAIDPGIAGPSPNPAPAVTLENLRLAGELAGERATFVLSASAAVENPKGGSVELVSGPIALTDLGAHPKWRLRVEQDHYFLDFERGGKFAIQVKFDASVRQSEAWKAITFQVAPGVLQPIVLHGLGADTQFEFAGAARPQRTGSDFTSYLPSDGAVKLSWKEAKPEAEGKLFYAAEMLSQISVSPGLMRQVALFDFKIMQGELNRVALRLRGAGEVTRVQGEQVLAWNVEAVPGSAERRLVVQFNQPQKDQFALQVQVQAPLGAFPQTAEAMQLRPEAATRFAGYFRIVNEGAVRLEVAQASGLSQVSPEQFPESDTTRSALRVTGNQRFAYRFSGGDFGLRIQADQILPEVSVSQVLAYRLGENEETIDAEIELDIREAPLRELLLRVPKGYALARLTAAGMSDYFVREPEGAADAELRLVYGQPMSGRQLVQLRLERNQPLAEATWELPRLEVAKAKSVRGHLGVTADAGFRLTPERTQGLTEIATAFFPRKVAGLQSAFRLSDPGWQAAVRVERLPQTVQADVFHLFSIGEGIAYGSSVLNYVVSGAPVSAFKVELSDEYFNVEFTGKDVRNWQKTDRGYVVQLHTPVAGPYTLLATYERPFKAQGETLTFTGARSLDAQFEHGHTLIISAYQFKVMPVDVSAGLLALEPAEVPAEYRLFFDAPILRAYQYNSRPFNLKLALSPLTQGDSLNQVVDRASLTTRISKEGQVLTDVRYFVKNRGNTHFNLTLPDGAQLWSVNVNDLPVVPVTNAHTAMIPLPQQADPNGPLKIDLKIASSSKLAERVRITAPIVDAPVLVAEWKLAPDEGQRLVYRRGSLTPTGGVLDLSGFAELARAFHGDAAGRATTSLLLALALLGAALVLWRWAARDGGYRFSARHTSGAALGLLALGFAVVALFNLGDVVGQQRVYPANELTFLAPVEQTHSTLEIEVSNVSDQASLLVVLGYAWPALLALPLWIYGLLADNRRTKTASWLLGWTLLAWSALRSPHGATVFLLLTAAFLVLHVVVPAVRGLWRLPRRPETMVSAKGHPGAAPAAAAVLLGGLVWLSVGGVTRASEPAQDSMPPGTQSFVRSSARSAMFVAATSRGEQAPLGAACGETIMPLDNMPLLTELEKTNSHSAFYQHGAPNGAFPGAHSTLKSGLAHSKTWRRNPPVLCSPSVQHAAPPAPSRPESVTHDIRVEDKFVVGSAKIRWQAEKGDLLPLLAEPAVLTRINFPTNSLKLVSGPTGSKLAQQLLAEKNGVFDLEVHYELPVIKSTEQSFFVLPVRSGLVNRLTLTAVNLDVDVLSSQAVFVHRETAGSNTVATLSLSPADNTWVAWKPRSRDVKNEKPVFYAEVSQLYVPAAGVIEGVHYVSIRPAQGELSELVLDVPKGAAITDVLDPAKAGSGADRAKSPAAAASFVSLWRFDPDTRRLRVTLAPAQSRPFVLVIRSQISTGPLPFEQTVGLVSVENAAGQIGLLGLATGNEVQLDTVEAKAFSPINLEDFPAEVAASLQAQVAGLTVRRAFRYGDSTAMAVLKASPVEPDVRVETQDTLSLGEDRAVLAVNATAEITRAGIFRLSFIMPSGFDVDAISGSALSHWTESKTEAGRLITLHLGGKTEGQQQFTIALAGPGVKAAKDWLVPQVVLREASKQRGTLLVVPEQGMRLQAAAREGVTQLDPQKSGIRQKGVLAFRVLQNPWKLSLEIEQVEPWVQVTSLQQATVNEAQVKVAANLQYQIENTGLKALRVFVSTNADGVHFQGDQVAMFTAVAGVVTNGLQEWEVKLQRRVIGPYLLQVTYQTPLSGQSPDVTVRGVQAAEVNLQRGFVTIQSGGRLQLHVEAAPESLQPAEWQSIPRALQQDLPAAAANFTYRLVEPAFVLPLKLERHEAARLLPARVNNITLTSVISDAGVMLTRVRLEMLPGDKRLLNLTLPKGAEFWFAFVNQNGVWPWREKDGLLLPLEQQSRTGKPLPVEIFYSCAVNPAKSGALNLELLAPKFDLPLENLTWRVCLDEKWRLKKWSGALQLQQEEFAAHGVEVDLQTYLQNETTLNLERTKEAEDLMAAANAALDQGSPQQARRAFQAAYGLSTHDAAFNEDARVQLHNIKLQQALIGLNVRQAEVAGESGALGGKFRDLRGRKEVAYSQQDAKDIIDRNTADDNAAYMRLAERLIQQQDAAVSSATPIRASVPEQGRVFTFKRSVVVDAGADLNIALRAVAVRAASGMTRVLILMAAMFALAALAWLVRRPQTR